MATMRKIEFDPEKAIFRFDPRITPKDMALNPLLSQAIVGSMIRQAFGYKLTEDEKKDIKEYNRLILRTIAEAEKKQKPIIWQRIKRWLGI